MPEELASPRPNTRITVGEAFADIVINREGAEPIYYWIAQRFGSAEVVGWGQDDSFERAEQNARDFLADLVIRSERAGKAANVGQHS